MVAKEAATAYHHFSFRSLESSCNLISTLSEHKFSSKVKFNISFKHSYSQILDFATVERNGISSYEDAFV